MDEYLQQALVKVEEAHRDGVNLTQYLVAEGIYGERDPLAELGEAIEHLARDS